MPSITKTYDPKKWLTTFAGIPLTAYAEGTFITVEFDEDSFTKKTGAGGEVVRVLNNNAGAKATVVLMAHSADNDALSAIALQDRLTGEGVGLFAGKELNGTSTVFGEAWIQKIPNLERAKDASEVSWVFDMPNAVAFLGGLF
jgi:hypothetical protein